MKAGILIDRWKLPVFERLLKKDNFKYVEQAGVTKQTLSLIVEYADLKGLKDLEKVVKSANLECIRSKMN